MLKERQAEGLIHLRAGLVPRTFQADEAETVQRLNRKLGFWCHIRHVRSRIALGKFAAKVTAEYEWRCGCNCMAMDGVVVQKVVCRTHGASVVDAEDDLLTD